MAVVDICGRTISTEEIQDLLATDHPMVERFRFEEERGYGDGMRFALRIIPRPGVRYLQQRDSRGRRVEPVWRTLGDEERIGQGNRAIWREGGELVAENCTFFPNQEFNDLGIGSALYVSMERFYRELGIRRVSLFAVDVGVYVWARQGFAFADSGTLRSQAAGLRGFLRANGAEDDAADVAFEESWEIANYEQPGFVVDGYRAGKAFMLAGASVWHGIKHLDDPRHVEVAEASRRETFARLPDKIEGGPSELLVR